MTRADHGLSRPVAALLAAGLWTVPCPAQQPVEIRYPELVAYSNTVAETIQALTVTNFNLIHTQLLVQLNVDTAGLNGPVFEGISRCRAAIPLVDDPLALNDLADESFTDLNHRERAFFHTELLWKNRFVGYAELRTNAIYHLNRALDAAYANLPALDARLTALHDVSVPPFFLAWFRGPKTARPGSVVELVAEIWNVGDLAAENVSYRMIDLFDYVVPRPAPIDAPDLPAGGRRTHSFFVRMPSDGRLDGHYSFTVVANGAQTASRMHYIETGGVNGIGMVRADGGAYQVPGGGGRIALYYPAASSDTTQLTITSSAGVHASRTAGDGTVHLDDTYAWTGWPDGSPGAGLNAAGGGLITLRILDLEPGNQAIHLMWQPEPGGHCMNFCCSSATTRASCARRWRCTHSSRPNSPDTACGGPRWTTRSSQSPSGQPTDPSYRPGSITTSPWNPTGPSWAHSGTTG